MQMQSVWGFAICLRDNAATCRHLYKVWAKCYGEMRTDSQVIYENAEGKGG
jgi:hypothetical protein